MTDAEKWARIVIFILVGGYAILVLFLTIRFVIRNCFLQNRNEADVASRWDQFISENIARRQQVEAPPVFEEAVTMKMPISVIEVVDEANQPPPSYEEYVRKYSTDSTSNMKPFLSGIRRNSDDLCEEELNHTSNNNDNVIIPITTNNNYEATGGYLTDKDLNL